jgi:hypothetical protein
MTGYINIPELCDDEKESTPLPARRSRAAQTSVAPQVLDRGMRSVSSFERSFL